MSWRKDGKVANAVEGSKRWWWDAWFSRTEAGPPLRCPMWTCRRVCPPDEIRRA